MPKRTVARASGLASACATGHRGEIRGFCSGSTHAIDATGRERVMNNFIYYLGRYQYHGHGPQLWSEILHWPSLTVSSTATGYSG
jgi:hypothetical protein